MSQLQGPSGATGPQGIQGEQGVQGEQGIQGIQGIQGVPGVQGVVGATGDTGIQGVKGDKGEKGIQGIQGVKGDKGDQGIQGVKGDKGEKGDQGIQGVKGDKGEKGDQGIQGVPGVKGDKGEQGVQGVPGVKGDKGEQGVQGPQGVSFSATSGTFQSSYVGSVLRDSNAKGSDIVSVKDFGAVGNGSANDAPAIQNAINAVNALGGGAVYLPRGRYLVTSQIRICSNLVLYGDGSASEITSNNNDAVLVASSGILTNLTIRDLRISTSMTTVPSNPRNYFGMIYINGPAWSNISILNNFFSTGSYANGAAIHTSGKTCSNLLFSNNSFEATKRMGIEVFDKSLTNVVSQVRIVNNRFNNCELMGVSVVGGVQEIVIADNIFSNSTEARPYGIEVNARVASIIGNIFSGNYGSVFSISPNTPAVPSGDGIRVAGNITRGQVAGRVWLTNFLGGIFESNHLSLTDAVILSDNRDEPTGKNQGDGSIFRNNVIATTKDVVFAFKQANNVLIESNTLSNPNVNTSGVIVLNNMSNARIVNNRLNKGIGGGYISNNISTYTSSGNIFDGRNEATSSVGPLHLATLSRSGGPSTWVKINLSDSPTWQPNIVQLDVMSVGSDGTAVGFGQIVYYVISSTATTVPQVVSSRVLIPLSGLTVNPVAAADTLNFNIVNTAPVAAGVTYSFTVKIQVAGTGDYTIAS